MAFSPVSPLNPSDDNMAFSDGEAACIITYNDEVFVMGYAFSVATQLTGCVAVVSPTSIAVIPQIMPIVRHSGVLFAVPADPSDAPSVNRIVPDGNNGYYLVGSLRSVVGMPGDWDNMPKLVVHVGPGGVVDPNFKIRDSRGSSVQQFDRGYEVHLDSVNNILYVGGEFNIGQFSTLMAVDATTGFIIETWNPIILGGSVAMTLREKNGFLYVGGDFDYVNSLSRANLARFDISSFPPVLDAWDAGANAPVYTINVETSTILIGGAFTGVSQASSLGISGVVARNRVAEFTTAGAIGTFNPNASDVVHVIATTGNDIYIGGEFFTISASSRNCVAKFISGVIDGWNPALFGVDGDVRSVSGLLIDGSNIYLGGEFQDNFPYNLATFWNICRVDSVTAARDTSWTPLPQVESGIFQIIKDRGMILLAGSFSGLGSLVRFGLKYDADGNLDPTFDPPEVVQEIDSAGDTGAAIVNISTGVFLAVGCNAAVNLISLTTGAIVYSVAVNATVSAIAQIPGTVDFVIGGGFTTVNGVSHTRLAKILGGSIPLVPDNVTWLPTVAGGTVGTLYWAAVPDGGTGLGYIFIGGNFTTINGTARSKAGSVDTNTGTLSSFNPVVGISAGSPSIQSFMVFNSSILLMAGNYNLLNGVSTSNLTQVSSTTGALLTDFGVTNQCTSLTQVNNRVYLLQEDSVGNGIVNGQIRDLMAEIITVPTPTLWNISNGTTPPPGFGWFSDFAITANTICANSKYLYFSGGNIMGFQGGNVMHTGRCAFPDRVNLVGTDALTGKTSYVTASDLAIDINNNTLFGITGIAGLTGLPGATGISIQGSIGANLQGDTGIQGLTGLVGIMGRTGITASGILGITGFRGIDGVSTSPTGVRGITGFISATKNTVVSTSPYTALATDYYLLVDTTSIPITIILPFPSIFVNIENVKRFGICDVGGNAANNPITIQPTNPATINSQASLVINTNYGIMNMYTDSFNYFAWTSGVAITGATGIAGITGLSGITGVQGITGTASA